MPQKSTLLCRRCRRHLPHDNFKIIPRHDVPSGLRRETICLDCRANPLRRLAAECVPIPNPDDPSGQTMLVPLTKGKFAVIDAANLGRVESHRWYALFSDDHWYAMTFVAGDDGIPQTMLMHRLLLGDIPELGDHWDGDGLNNRMSNIRPASSTQNAMNAVASRNVRSGFKGVRVTVPSGRWQAYITIAGKFTHLGVFDTPVEAARAYDAAARKHFGEFARTNLDDPRHQ